MSRTPAPRVPVEGEGKPLTGKELAAKHGFKPHGRDPLTGGVERTVTGETKPRIPCSHSPAEHTDVAKHCDGFVCPDCRGTGCSATGAEEANRCRDLRAELEAERADLGLLRAELASERALSRAKLSAIRKAAEEFTGHELRRRIVQMLDTEKAATCHTQAENQAADLVQQLQQARARVAELENGLLAASNVGNEDEEGHCAVCLEPFGEEHQTACCIGLALYPGGTTPTKPKAER